MSSSADEEGKRVDDSGEHTHLVTLHAVKSLGRTREAAKYVAATYHDSHFYTFAYYIGNLTGIFAQSDSVYAITLRSHQRLAAEFEQYSLILCFHITNLGKITH